MKAITLSAPNATPEVSELEVPEPGPNEILVKTVYTAVNPVDELMAASGMMVASWPWTPGCDLSGYVAKVGTNAKAYTGEAWTEGAPVFGLTRIGVAKYAAWAEYVLMDAAHVFPKPANITFAEASTVGGGLLTAAISIVEGLKIPLPDPETLPAPQNEWALVFGGAGSVGQAAVQLLKAAGYKVVTTCSKKSVELMRTLNVDATVEYSLPPQEVVSEIIGITNSKLNLAFDAAGMNSKIFGSLNATLPSVTSSQPRLFATVNDFDPVPLGSDDHPLKSYGIALGPAGQPQAVELNAVILGAIPLLYRLLEKGVVKPSEYVVEGVGIEGILKAWDVQKKGVSGGKKVVIKVTDE